MMGIWKRLFGHSEIEKNSVEPKRNPEGDGFGVRALREKVGLSQQNFARLVGVPVGTIANWEQGRREPTGPAGVLLRLLHENPTLLAAADETISCEVCGSMFPPRRNSGGRPQRFCSINCRKIAKGCRTEAEIAVNPSINPLRTSPESQDHPLFIVFKDFAKARKDLTLTTRDAKKLAKKAGYKSSSYSAAMSVFIAQRWFERVAVGRYRLVQSPIIVAPSSSKITESDTTIVMRLIRAESGGISKNLLFVRAQGLGLDGSAVGKALARLVQDQRAIRFKEAGVERYYDWATFDQRTRPLQS